MSVTTAERPATALDVLKDNFEAFAIAIVMALVIKHFCVEAFRIPTGSMEPTLLGEDRDALVERLVPELRRLPLHVAVAVLHRLVQIRTGLVPRTEPRLRLADEEGGLCLLVTGQDLGSVHRFE